LRYRYHLLAITIVCSAIPTAAHAGAVAMMERVEAGPDTLMSAEPQGPTAADTIGAQGLPISRTALSVTA